MSILRPELALADLKRVSGYDRSLLREVKELSVSATVLSPSGAKHRPDLRSNHHAERFLSQTELFRCTPANQIPRSLRTGSCIYYQRLFTSGTDGCRSVQGTLADRTFLQMDQAAPTHQGLFCSHFSALTTQTEVATSVNSCRCETNIGTVVFVKLCLVKRS